MSIFHKDQLIWAKVKGYSWWPGKILASNRKKDGTIENQVEVFFLEENKVGKVGVKMIVDYETGYEEYSKGKGKRLTKAIELSREIHRKSKSKETEQSDSKHQKKSGHSNLTESGTKAQGRKSQTTPNLGKRSLQLAEDTTQNESPRLSKVEKKQQRKAQEKLGSDLHLDLLQRRSTRALSKNNEIEVLSEPIIYSVKKMRKHEGHSKRDSSFEGSMNEDSNSFLQTEFCETQKPEQTVSEENPMKPVSEKPLKNENNNMLAQLETMSKLIKINAQRKENKNILDEADQEKLSKILTDFQNQIHNGSSLNQNSFKILHQVVTLLLKNQNLLQIKETLKDQLVNIKNYYSKSWDTTDNIEININCEQNDTNKENTIVSQESQIFFRKSVCQKLAKLLEEVYCLEKDPAQELTLLIEGRINNYFSETPPDYKKAIKALYKLLKVKLLTVEELKSIIGLKSDEFKSWLKLKVQKFINNHKQSDDIEIEIEQIPALI